MRTTYEARWGNSRTRRPRGYWRERREQRHKEALERQEKYNRLSLQQRIEKLNRANEPAHRERARIMSAIGTESMLAQ